MICGLRKRSGRAPYGIFEGLRESGMKKTDNAMGEKTQCS